VESKISRQALHQRLDESAVNFLKACLERVISVSVERSQPVNFQALRAFKRVCIWDSSGWQLSPKLKKAFKGHGGMGSVAGCKLQYCYEVKSSSILHSELTEATVPDQRYGRQNISSLVRKGDLFLFDLGYFSFDLLFKILSQGAYFVSRLGFQQTFFIEDKRLNLVSWLKKHKSSNYIEANVLLGDKKLPVRLVAIRLADKAIQQRRRKIRRAAKRKNRTPSADRLFFAAWNVFVTNAPEDKLPTQQIYPVYRLRWSVELIFKQFKSHLNIDSWNHANANRLQCEIFATLLVSALLGFCQNLLQQALWKKNQTECSLEKTIKFFANNSDCLLQLAARTISRPIDAISQLLTKALKYCIKTKQPSRLSSVSRIMGGLA